MGNIIPDFFLLCLYSFQPHIFNWLIKMKKSNKILTILVLLIGSVSFGFLNQPNLFTLTDSTIDYDPIDIGPILRSSELPIRGALSQSDTAQLKSADSNEYYQINDTLEWLLLDDYTGVTNLTSFKLKAFNDGAEIWLQEDLSYLDNRETPVVTQEQINYFLEEFKTNINKTCVDYFGMPNFHNGSNAALLGATPDTYFEKNGRMVILLANIRDEMYYDDKYPYYIVGYYWGFIERMHDRNIVTIDVHDWENRVGDDAARANLYEATLAHEYQHLIHDDYNPYDDLFMNEGCSMYAEPLCGYPIDWGSINSFLFTPDNSLTEWGDQGDINILADYGQALLWTMYLSDHYGGADLISYFVKTGIPGITGIENALKHYEHYFTFDEIFHDWRIANLIHTNQIGEGKYNYTSIDLGSEDAIQTRIYDLKNANIQPKQGSDFGFTKTILNYNTHLSLLGSYGTDYILFSNLTTDCWGGSNQFALNFAFDGDNKATMPKWERTDQDGDGDLEWYSTSAKPESDVLLYKSITLPSEGMVTLSFDTFYQIEPLWDYGFVQISTDGGMTWISLANEYTTVEHDPDAYPAIVDYLPGLTDTSGTWINMEFNLTDYIGESSIMLGFRYMTDWGTEDLGWFIDNIKINGEMIDDADDLVTFEIPEDPEIDFIVTLIDVVDTEGYVDYNVIGTMNLDDIEETGLMEITNYISANENILVIVSPSKGPADYIFEVARTLVK